MSYDRFLALVAQSLRRHRRHFALSAVGVVIGIATLFFFTSLGEGVRTTVLEDIFIIDQLEVVDPAAGAGLRAGGLFGGGGGLDDRTVAELAALPGVRATFPKMKLTFPSRASGGGGLLGSDMGIEFIADGIPAELMGDEITDPLGFRDLEAPRSCTDDSGCFDGQSCDGGQCTFLECNPRGTSPCGELGYCHPQRLTCALPIPIIVSHSILEVYNGSLHTAMRDAEGIGGRLPRLSEEMLIGFEFDIIFGQSFMGRTADGHTRRERGRLVGFSSRAMQIGATMPLAYVRRLNEEFTGEEAAGHYHSILVEAESNDAVAPLARHIDEEMDLALSDRHRQAERAGLLILLLTLLFNLIALVILAVSALNITHTFSMMVMERRGEIGLMRALGATRRQIQALVAGEATVVGIIAGVLGVAMGFAATRFTDHLFQTQVGNFPFKPDTLFAFSPWMFGLAMTTAVVFCWIGALLPAIKAGRVEPSEALTGR